MATDLLAWRGRNDDGNETTATWKANQGVAWTQVTGVNLRVRFLHQQSAALVNNLNCQFQYSLNNVDWVDVTASSNVVRSSASANVTDAAATTSQLTGGSGTYIGATCFDEADGNCGGTALDVASTGQFETEYCCQVRDVDVVDGQTIYLRDWNSDTGAAWTTYSGGVASLTVSGTRKAATPAADALGSYNDSAPTIDKQDLASSDITVNVPPDANVAYGEILGTGRGFLGDTLNLWDDSQFDKTRRRIGWADAAVADRQVVASGAISVNVPADAMPSYSERLGLAWLRLADAFPAYTETISGEWTYPAWADSIVYDRPSIGVTPITRDVPADSLGLYTDQAPVVDKRGILAVAVPPDANAAYTERVGLGIELRGDTMPLADAAPTFTKIGFLTAVVPADSLGLYTDQPPVVYRTGYLTANIAADPNAAYGEQLGLGIGLRGDAMVLADAPPIVSKVGILSVNVPPDAWETLADQTPLFDKQVITTTPIPVPVPADSLGLYADQPPTFYETGAHLITPPADSLGLYADTAPIIDERGAIGVVVPTDANAAYTERLGLGIGLSGDSMAMADVAPIVDKQTVSATLIPINVGADPLQNWDDSLLTIKETGYLTATPPTDNLAAYAEQLGLGISLRDDLNQWADSRDATTTGLVPKSYNVPADALDNYAEQLGLGIGLCGDLMALADAPPVFIKMGTLTANVAADPWGNLADTAPTVVKTTNKTALVPTDANAVYAERLGLGVGFINDLANYGERVGLGIGLRENLANYDDSIQVTTGGDYRFSITDPMSPPQDATPLEHYGKFYAVPADGMVLGDTTPTYTLGKLYTVPDSLPAYSEVFGLGIGLQDSPTAYLDSADFAIFGYLFAALLDQNEDYAEAINILYLSFDQKAAQITESMVNWDDAAAFVRDIMALKLSGKVIDTIALDGKVAEETVSLNGKVFDKTDLSGELYTGE